MAGHTLQVQQPGLTIALRQDQSLLQSCLAAGVTLAHSCRNGNCQRCVATLVSGRVALNRRDIVPAPADIPLCISYPLSDIILDSLPLPRQASYWHIQPVNGDTWLLAAGGQPPPSAGQAVAVLQATRVVLSRVATCSGRNVSLAPPVTATNSAFLMALSHQTRGNHALWHKHGLRTHCLWSHLSADTAQLALSLCRRAAWPGQYWLN